MADIKVKLFGVMRVDSGAPELTVNASNVGEIFDKVSAELKARNAEHKDMLTEIKFNDALVYVNGERCKSKKKPVSASDEVWLMSPASGG